MQARLIKTLTMALSALFFGCAAAPKEPGKILTQNLTPPSIPFSYAGPLLKVPAKINGSIDIYLIFDTGIGVHLLSKSLCEKMDCPISKTTTGQRMSGQTLTISMSQQQSLTLASSTENNPHFGVWDMANGFLPEKPEFDNVEGFLSLNFFKNQAVTVDYANSIMVFETDESLKQREHSGQSVPIKIKDEDGALTIFMSLSLPNGPPALVEVDLGSNVLILDDQFMDRLAVDPEGENVKRFEAKDETGNPYVRHFSKIVGSISPENATQFSQQGMTVMFQKIIYDGLVGNDFMKRFTVTYDLTNKRLIFNR